MPWRSKNAIWNWVEWVKHFDSDKMAKPDDIEYIWTFQCTSHTQISDEIEQFVFFALTKIVPTDFFGCFFVSLADDEANDWRLQFSIFTAPTPTMSKWRARKFSAQKQFWKISFSQASQSLIYLIRNRKNFHDKKTAERRQNGKKMWDSKHFQTVRARKGLLRLMNEMKFSDLARKYFFVYIASSCWESCVLSLLVESSSKEISR